MWGLRALSLEIPADRMQRCWMALLGENVQVPEIGCWESCFVETQTHVRIESSLLLRFLLIECSVAGRPSWEKIYKSQKFNVESIVSSHSFYTVTQSDLAAVTTLKLRLTNSWELRVDLAELSNSPAWETLWRKFDKISVSVEVTFQVEENFSVKNDRELSFKSEPDAKNKICGNKIGSLGAEI